MLIDGQSKADELFYNDGLKALKKEENKPGTATNLDNRNTIVRNPSLRRAICNRTNFVLHPGTFLNYFSKK